MSCLIKRKIKTTTADVVDENGQTVTKMEVQGTISAPRMANIARRDFENPLVTVRNVVTTCDVYAMEEAEFMEHAERLGTVDPEEVEAITAEVVSE